MDDLVKMGIEEVLKAIIEAGGKVIPNIFGDGGRRIDKKKFHRVILDLYMQMKELEKELGGMIWIIESRDERAFGRILHDLRKTLAVIDLDLRKIDPLFEIHAVDAAPLIVDAYTTEMLYTFDLSPSDSWIERSISRAHSEDEKMLETTLSDITEIKSLAERARTALGGFIRTTFPL